MAGFNFESISDLDLDLIFRSLEMEKKRGWEAFSLEISEPGFDPGTCGLWAHHASAAPLWLVVKWMEVYILI